MINITKEQFNTFETVRRSGLTNMFQVDVVKKLGKKFTGVLLKDSEVAEIFRGYSQYKKKFNENEDE